MLRTLAVFVHCCFFCDILIFLSYELMNTKNNLFHLSHNIATKVLSILYFHNYSVFQFRGIN